MANLHLVTGYAGEEHITSDDQGSFNAAIMGTGQFVLERGNQFAASIISNNKVRVLDGDALMQGRHIRMKENTYEDLYFDNGLQGYNRIDLIVMRYTKDSATDIETANLVVIKGTPVEGEPVPPEHITGDIINEHDLINDTVLYKVPFSGLNIQPLEKVFSTVPTWETLKKQVIENISSRFDDFVVQAMQQIQNGEKPLVSNIDDMLLIENYGEYAADAKTVGEAFSEINSNLRKNTSITVTAAQLNAAIGGNYFSSGGVVINYNDYFVHLDFELYFNISLQPNATYGFRVPEGTPWVRHNIQKMIVTASGQRAILSISQNNVFSFIGGEIINAGDTIREDFFCLS